MRALTARWVAWSAGIASIVLLVGALVLLFLDRKVLLPESVGAWSVAGVFSLLLYVCVPAIGILILDRRPPNTIGWLFIAAGVALAIGAFGQFYALHALRAVPGSLPGGRLAAWLSSWAGSTSTTALLFLLLLFPTGTLPSRRYRAVAWFVGAMFLEFTAGSMIYATSIWSRPFAGSRAATGSVADAARLMIVVGALAVPLALLLCLVSVAIRYVRSGGEERLQLKWFVAAASIVAVTFPVGIFWDSPAANAIQHLGLLCLFSAIAVAILRYRLYDIDVIIGKAIVYGGLAALITVVYLIVVVAIGAVVGATEGLALVATAIVAVAFQPYRQRAQRVANRIVYGQRATPYEVLSEFSEHVGGTYGGEELLPRMVRLVAEGTGASSVIVWLCIGPELRPAAVWPPEHASPAPIRLVGGAVPPIEGAGVSVPVNHQGELLGALSLTKPPKETLSPAEDKLLTDLAAQVGLVLRNSRLIEELRASRQRLVAAQDEARRRLERDLHDGAQQQIVALAVRLKLARSLAQRDRPKADEMLEQLEVEVADALDTLRDLARGIYPSLLVDKGLATALEAQSRKVPLPVTVDADGIGRYAQEFEAAVYFCVLEALQNTSKYSGSPDAIVRLVEEDHDLVFSVVDHGRGFDPETTPPGSGLQNMADRLAALGGTLDIRSRPGGGTTVLGRIPAPAVRSTESVA